VAAARGLVHAEQNFNPFVVSVPSICSDPSLPASKQLRGVLPLIDPAVVGSALENANANKSLTNPFSANGLSVAQVMVAQGFSNFTAVDKSGNKVAASNLGSKASSGSSNSNTGSSKGSAAVSAAPAAVKSAVIDCGTPTTLAKVVASSRPVRNPC
jgi:hypothetical protein